MTSYNDHPDTDLTDPHGEAEALRRENSRLRAEVRAYMDAAEANAVEAFLAIDRAEAAEAALANEGLQVVTDDDMRRKTDEVRRPLDARTIAQAAAAYRTLHREEFAASRPPDPVVNAGSCQPGDRISRAELRRRHAIESHDAQMADAQAQCVPCKMCGGPAVISDAGVGYGYNISCSNGADGPRGRQRCLQSGARISGWAYNASDLWNRLNALPAAPVAEAQPVAWRWETTSEHIARDMREGRFPEQSERQRIFTTPPAKPAISWAELDALVLRLRTITSSGCNPYSACHEAADAITALREKLALAVSLADERDTLVAETITLNKLVERLREALERLAKLGNGDRYGNSEGNMIARAALSDLAALEPEGTND